MVNYYTDSAKKSLWVISTGEKGGIYFHILTCFSATDDSGFHIGQQIHGPKLVNSNWQPLEGEIPVSDILYV